MVSLGPFSVFSTTLPRETSLPTWREWLALTGHSAGPRVPEKRPYGPARLGAQDGAAWPSPHASAGFVGVLPREPAAFVSLFENRMTKLKITPLGPCVSVNSECPLACLPPCLPAGRVYTQWLLLPSASIGVCLGHGGSHFFPKFFFLSLSGGSGVERRGEG